MFRQGVVLGVIAMILGMPMVGIIMPSGPSVLPAAGTINPVTNLQASWSVTIGGNVILTWSYTNGSLKADGFNVYGATVSDANTPFLNSSFSEPAANRITFSGLNQFTSYVFTVNAFNSSMSATSTNTSVTLIAESISSGFAFFSQPVGQWIVFGLMMGAFLLLLVYLWRRKR